MLYTRDEKLYDEKGEMFRGICGLWSNLNQSFSIFDFVYIFKRFF